MAMSGYELNKNMLERTMQSSAVEMLAAARKIAGCAKGAEDLLDLLDVLGITKDQLIIGVMELEQLRL